MKLRVRILNQTSRVDLPGEPSLTELRDHMKETLLPALGLGADADFSLSLNGSDTLSDTGQTLASCGIVSGDLICVILPESVTATLTQNANSASSRSTASSTESAKLEASISSFTSTSASSDSVDTGARHTRQTPDMSSDQPSSSSSSLPQDPPQASSAWDPMLCCEAEDGQAPLSLELLYDSAQTSSPSDAVMVAVHQLMIETGFVPQGSGLQAGEMPSGWRSVGGAYRLKYVHPLCEGSEVTVAAVCLGSTLNVNATLKVNEAVDTMPKLTLSPSSYVTDWFPGKSAAGSLKDLKKLSRLFKDQLANRLIAAARAAMSLPEAFGLVSLPPELILRVLRLLDVVSVVRLSAVCKHLNAATSDSTLWKYLYRRDFEPSGSDANRAGEWKTLYKRSYKLRADLRRFYHPHSLPPLPWNPPDIFQPIPLPMPLHPLLPGIIGGEYDQRPILPVILPPPPPRFEPIGPIRDPLRRPQSLPPRVRSLGGRSSNVRRGFI